MNQVQTKKTALTQLRASLAAAAAELDAHLFPANRVSMLVGEQFILVEKNDPARALMRLNGSPAVGMAPVMLSGVSHYSLENAQRVAAKVKEQGGPELVPVTARSWQMQALDDLSRQLADLDDLLAECSE